MKAFSHEPIFAPPNAKPNLAILYKVGIGPKLPQMPNNRGPAPAYFCRDPSHAQFVDPPFSCQLGVIDFPLPGDHVKCI